MKVSKICVNLCQSVSKICCWFEVVPRTTIFFFFFLCLFILFFSGCGGGGGSSTSYTPPSNSNWFICTGGRTWDGFACVCPTGQSWNGIECVSPAPADTGKIEGYVKDEDITDQSGITVVVEEVSQTSRLTSDFFFASSALNVEDPLGSEYSSASKYFDFSLAPFASLREAEYSPAIENPFVGSRLNLEPTAETVGAGLAPALRATSKITRTTTTDAKGYFKIENLPNGIYTACAIKVPNVQNPNCSDVTTDTEKYKNAENIKIALPTQIEITSTKPTVTIGTKNNETEEIIPGFFIKKVGTIKGKVTLSGTTNHQGILCYIAGTSFIAMTDSTGNYTMSNVPAGTHIITCTKSGYTDGAKAGINVIAGQTMVVPEITLSNNTPTCLLSIKWVTVSKETIYAGETTTINVTVGAEQCSALTYSYTTTAGTISGTGASVVWTAPTIPGLYTIYVLVSDGGKTATSQKSILVLPKPLPTLTINSLTATPQEITAGATVTLGISVTYTGTSQLSYSWSTSAGSITGKGASAIWKAPTTAGTYTISLSITDGTQTINGNWNLTVKPVANAKPTVTLSASPVSGTAPLTVNFTITCTDSDGTCVSYSLDFRDGSSSITNYKLQITNYATHTYSTAGTYTAVLTATDNSGATSAESRVTITVSANHNPVITTTPPATATVGIPYTYDVNATDADGDTLTYSLINQAATNMAINSTTGLITWAPTATGTYNVIASVTDNKGGTATQGWTITVSSPDTLRAVKIAVGRLYGDPICVITLDKTVKCWRYITDREGITRFKVNEQLDISNAIAISVGYAHTCAILSDRTVKCWGDNSYSQLGNGTTEQKSNLPVLVKDVYNAVAITAGGNRTCAIIFDGSVKCWGEGEQGKPEPPRTVVDISGAIGVAIGWSLWYGYHTCALISDGSVKCWGGNFFRESNLNTRENYLSSPVTVPDVSDAIAIAAGTSHTCALISDGFVKCWGNNSFSQLGCVNRTNYIPENYNKDSFYEDWCQICDDYYSLCEPSGILLQSCDPEPGLEGLFPCSKKIASVPGISTATAIAADRSTTCVLLSDSTVKCWGELDDGSDWLLEKEVGRNAYTTRPDICTEKYRCTATPTIVNGITSAIAISGSVGRGCAILSDNTVKCWFAFDKVIDTIKFP